MKLLVLYEELAGYTITCLNVLAELHGFEILVLSKRVNPVAPFRFDNLHQKVAVKDRDSFTDEQMSSLINNFKPQALLLGGWGNKRYLTLTKKLALKNTIIAFDNHWTGSIKQRIGAFYFRTFLKPKIKYAFVPGAPQEKFAIKLGFDKSTIRTGFYCCDQPLFNGYYEKVREQKQKEFPRRFLYVGRYAPEKGIGNLWEAFIKWQQEKPNEWELWCLGKGELPPVQHPKIKHLGFLQPDEMQEVIRDTGVFVLPSSFEPWGVVVQEYAAAGFPILCTQNVGAATLFVKEGENGFVVEAGRPDQLKEKMNIFSSLKPEQLVQMAVRSNELVAQLTPVKWAEILKEMTAL